MNINHRLGRIETHLASLPLSGRALTCKLERLTPSEVDAAIRGMTDEELEAIIAAGQGETGIDVKRLSDEELEAIIAGDASPLERLNEL